MIKITPDIALDEKEIKIAFVRAAKPGGQNVNKVATAAQLRFDVQNSPSLSDEVRTRLLRLAGQQLTKEGILIIHAQRFRERERNQRDAIDRLVELIRRAAKKPKPRYKTKVSRTARARRLEKKRRLSEKKNSRSYKPRSED